MTTPSPLAIVNINMRLKSFISPNVARQVFAFVLGLVLTLTFAVTGVQAFDCCGVQSCACCKMETLGHSPMAAPGTHPCDWPAQGKSTPCNLERPVSSLQDLFVISSDRQFFSDFSNFTVHQQSEDIQAFVATNINPFSIAATVIPKTPIYLKNKSFRC